MTEWNKIFDFMIHHYKVAYLRILFSDCQFARASDHLPAQIDNNIFLLVETTEITKIIGPVKPRVKHRIFPFTNFHKKYLADKA